MVLQYVVQHVCCYGRKYKQLTKLKWGESGFGINVIATGETDHEFEPDINIPTKYDGKQPSYFIYK